MKRILTLKNQFLLLLIVIVTALAFCMVNGRCYLLTDDQLGYRFFKQANYEQAAISFSDPTWQAAALFRNAEFEKAAAIYAGYDTPEAAYNQANALIMLGNYESAVGRFQRALELRPGWPEAQENLEIALSRQEYLKKEGGNMTEGMLGADDYSFDTGKSPSDSSDATVQDDADINNAELQSVWLRQVQTRPADFLKAKFAYQQAMSSTSPAAAATPARPASPANSGDQQ